MQLRLENMTCGGCARSVTRAIKDIDPEAEISARPAERLVDITTRLPQEQIEAALKAAGFPAS